MCVPGCQETILERLSRRRFLTGALAATAAAAVAGPAAAAESRKAPPANLGGKIREIVEMTHVMGPDFPTFSGAVNLEIEVLFTFAQDGFNFKRWLLIEHTGTHMDAPLHFTAEGLSADMIPIDQLVVPLAVVDIRHKAAANPDAQVTPDDLRAWEKKHGRIPDGACVAMYSGWEEKLYTPGFRNADAGGVMHFPGFHLEAVQFLARERHVNGIAVDTLSLDFGPSPDFATHYFWLGEGRWGMENVANLGKVPPVGSTFIAGGPRIAGATGGPSRCLALVHHPRRGQHG